MTASTSHHWKLHESPLWRGFHIAGQYHTGLGVALPGCDEGIGLGVGLAGCRFLCAGKYITLLIEHEWGGPQHPAYEGVKSLGILFMTWRAQRSLMVCCVPVQDVLSQGILSSNTTWGISGCSEGSPACYRQLVVIFYPLTLSLGSCNTGLSDLSSGWLYYPDLLTNSNVKELLFIIPLCKDKQGKLFLF